MQVDKQLNNRHPLRVIPDYTREPDEHEFFVLGVAHCMAELLTTWQQLNQIPVLISQHRQTVKMTEAGINRHSLIVYHLENYIVRTRSILDRALKLIDATFHLTNDSRNCRYEVITKNVKVKVSSTSDVIKKLKNLVDRYSGVRNEIVHEHSIKDDDLRRLEFWFLLERWERISPTGKSNIAKDQIKETIFEVLWFKKKELAAFNKELGEALSELFNCLQPYYAREERTLKLRLSKTN